MFSQPILVVLCSLHSIQIAHVKASKDFSVILNDQLTLHVTTIFSLAIFNLAIFLVSRTQLSYFPSGSPATQQQFPWFTPAPPHRQEVLQGP